MPDILDNVQRNLEDRVNDVRDTMNREVDIIKDEANQVGDAEPLERVFNTANRSAKNVVDHLRDFNRNNRGAFKDAKRSAESKVEDTGMRR